MNDLVVIPTYARPEYLQVTLEHLAVAERSSPIDVWIFQDRHNFDSPSTLHEQGIAQRIAEEFKALPIRFVQRAKHSFRGNPYNILEAYKEAYATNARYVYLVEDDVIVSPDFFRWHEAIQERGDYFCTVGWHCIRNPEVKKSDDPTAYIETTRDFSSIGVCWKREKLARVVHHARAEYYRGMAPYCRDAFPGNPIPCRQWTEQAGIIMRILLQSPDALTVAWPSLARCAHVGINGYHRPGRAFRGGVKERTAALRSAAQDQVKLDAVRRKEDDDISILPHVPDWKPEDLHVSQAFKWNGRL